jgi:hypothetical protein
MRRESQPSEDPSGNSDVDIFLLERHEKAYLKKLAELSEARRNGVVEERWETTQKILGAILNTCPDPLGSRAEKSSVDYDTLVDVILTNGTSVFDWFLTEDFSGRTLATYVDHFPSGMRFPRTGIIHPDLLRLRLNYSPGIRKQERVDYLLFFDTLFAASAEGRQALQARLTRFPARSGRRVNPPCALVIEYDTPKIRHKGIIMTGEDYVTYISKMHELRSLVISTANESERSEVLVRHAMMSEQLEFAVGRIRPPRLNASVKRFIDSALKRRNT